MDLLAAKAAEIQPVHEIGGEIRRKGNTLLLLCQLLCQKKRITYTVACFHFPLLNNQTAATANTDSATTILLYTPS